jgi:hypothetical protein
VAQRADFHAEGPVFESPNRHLYTLSKDFCIPSPKKKKKNQKIKSTRIILLFYWHFNRLRSEACKEGKNPVLLLLAVHNLEILSELFIHGGDAGALVERWRKHSRQHSETFRARVLDDRRKSKFGNLFPISLHFWIDTPPAQL